MTIPSADFNAQIIEEFRASGGRVGGMFEGVPLLLLHHRGAKSGRERVNPLAYNTDGGRYITFASKGGAPSNPDWYATSSPSRGEDRSRNRHHRRGGQRGDWRGARAPVSRPSRAQWAGDLAKGHQTNRFGSFISHAALHPSDSCICGPSGTGKSHFIEALGHLAIDRGKTVGWHTPETLAQLVHRHRADDSVNKAVSKLIRCDLVLIDDVGLLPISSDAAEALFRVVDAAYEKRSIAISSNIHPAGFDELMPKTLATATVERLLHHAHVVITDGQDSYRLAQATAGKGVMPLT
jgi:hypothetical protein